MKMNQIIDRIERVKGEYLQFVGANVPETNDAVSAKVKQNVDGLMYGEKPKVLVYGIYNAGKSTLINALLREKRAKISDRPETDSIDRYEMEKYTLHDSPGVDAPIDHEKVTEAFLGQCHVILYVISSNGGFESKENYKRMVELINKDIPFLIILNERAVSTSPMASSEDKQRMKMEFERNIADIKTKILDNLVKISGNPQIKEKYEVISLNAKKAFSSLGKENQTKCYADSHVDILDQKLSQILSTEMEKIYIQPIENLKDLIKDTEIAFSFKNSTSKTKNYETISNTISTNFENAKSKIKNSAEELVSGYESRIKSSYRAGNQDEVRSHVNEACSALMAECTKEMEQRKTYLEQNFSDLYVVDSGGMNIHDVDLKDVDNERQVDEIKSSSGSSGGSDGLGGLEYAPALVLPFVAPITIPVEVTMVVLTIATKLLKVIFGSDSSEEAMERKLDEQNRVAQQQAAERERFEKDVNDATKHALYEIKKAALASFDTYIDDYKASIYSRIREIEAKNQKNSDLFKEKTEILVSLTKALNEIKQQIV